MKTSSKALRQQDPYLYESGVQMRVVSLHESFALFTETWSPKIVGELNNFYVKLAKFQGPFIWHHHEEEDELFFVVNGLLTMEVREDGVEHAFVVKPGELLIVPHGIEHRPVADTETHVVLFEPKATLNTGNVHDDRTKEQLAWI